MTQKRKLCCVLRQLRAPGRSLSVTIGRPAARARNESWWAGWKIKASRKVCTDIWGIRTCWGGHRPHPADRGTGGQGRPEWPMSWPEVFMTRPQVLNCPLREGITIWWQHSGTNPQRVRSASHRPALLD